MRQVVPFARKTNKYPLNELCLGILATACVVLHRVRLMFYQKSTKYNENITIVSARK